ncbi:MAG: CBS domain-containing protein [Candidatus Aenigmarchaeota archaeon]|nr:CBS domain-containing protein [Candidatus Aenigmarchaeota archaeon]
MKKFADILVKHFISPAITIPPDLPVREAITRLQQEGADLLSVVDGNKLAGAVSEANLLKLVRHEPASPMGDVVWFTELDPAQAAEPVSSIMTTNITTLGPQDTLAAAFRLMHSSGYKLLHVVEGSRLLGIIRIRDVLEQLLKE